MIKIKAKHIILYAIGSLLLIFGQRSFWEGVKKEEKQRGATAKAMKEAEIAVNKKFEVQTLIYDSIQDNWYNKDIYFQTLHVGNVNFKALKRFNKTVVETNDDEDASDSF